MRLPSGRSWAGAVPSVAYALPSALPSATRSGLASNCETESTLPPASFTALRAEFSTSCGQRARGDDRDAAAAQLAARDVRERLGVEAVALGDLGVCLPGVVEGVEEVAAQR